MLAQVFVSSCIGVHSLAMERHIDLLDGSLPQNSSFIVIAVCGLGVEHVSSYDLHMAHLFVVSQKDCSICKFQTRAEDIDQYIRDGQPPDEARAIAHSNCIHVDGNLANEVAVEAWSELMYHPLTRELFAYLHCCPARPVGKELILIGFSAGCSVMLRLALLFESHARVHRMVACCGPPDEEFIPYCHLIRHVPVVVTLYIQDHWWSYSGTRPYFLLELWKANYEVEWHWEHNSGHCKETVNFFLHVLSYLVDELQKSQ